MRPKCIRNILILMRDRVITHLHAFVLKRGARRRAAGALPADRARCREPTGPEAAERWAARAGLQRKPIRRGTRRGHGGGGGGWGAGRGGRTARGAGAGGGQGGGSPEAGGGHGGGRKDGAGGTAAAGAAAPARPGGRTPPGRNVYLFNPYHGVKS